MYEKFYFTINKGLQIKQFPISLSKVKITWGWRRVKCTSGDSLAKLPQALYMCITEIPLIGTWPEEIVRQTVYIRMFTSALFMIAKYQQIMSSIRKFVV